MLAAIVLASGVAYHSAGCFTYWRAPPLANVGDGPASWAPAKRRHASASETDGSRSSEWRQVSKRARVSERENICGDCLEPVANGGRQRPFDRRASTWAILAAELRPGHAVSFIMTDRINDGPHHDGRILADRII